MKKTKRAMPPGKAMSFSSPSTSPLQNRQLKQVKKTGNPKMMKQKKKG